MAGVTRSQRGADIVTIAEWARFFEHNAKIGASFHGSTVMDAYNLAHPGA
jgi:hypothetical protein